jgi:hypothetical protein
MHGHKAAPLALEALQRAIELSTPAERLELNAAQASYTALYDYDWKEAERLFRIAPDTGVTDSNCQINTRLLLPMGLAQEAVLELERALEEDQPGKPDRSTDLKTEFPVNMSRYVDEVRATGATPVLITPLARRSFRKGKVTNDLAPWADTTRNVAREAGVPVLDLNTTASRQSRR